MLSFLLGLIDPITKITNGIIALQTKKVDATTEQAKIAADEQIKVLQAKRDVLIAEAGSRVNAFMRAALAAPVAIVLWKVFVWDKALGQWTSGRTDALDANLWNVVMAVIGFYFLYEGAVGVARIIKR